MTEENCTIKLFGTIKYTNSTTQRITWFRQIATSPQSTPNIHYIKKRVYKTGQQTYTRTLCISQH
ncbi:hypothetical protein LguiB_005007 [Lonicera macranthoides]